MTVQARGRDNGTCRHRASYNVVNLRAASLRRAASAIVRGTLCCPPSRPVRRIHAMKPPYGSKVTSGGASCPAQEVLMTAWSTPGSTVATQ